jgi:hypothetical protein
VPWEGLHGQMGAEYAELRDFKKKVIATLRKVQIAYPALKLKTTSEGLVISPASTAIPTKSLSN